MKTKRTKLVDSGRDKEVVTFVAASFVAGRVDFSIKLERFQAFLLHSSSAQVSQVGIMLLKCMGFSGSKDTSSSKKRYPKIIEELCHQFSREEIRTSTNYFDQKLVIGRNCSGTIYKGYLKHNGATDYMITLKRLDSRNSRGLREFMKEIEVLSQLRHPNLVSLIGFCNHKDEKIIVCEYTPNRSLRDCLWKMELMSWKNLLEICIGVARGIHYLHTGAKRSIFHRDINLHDILLDNNVVPKLSDFGCCLQGPLSTSKPEPIVANRIQGTSGFMAPEYVIYGTVTDKCDVYSFGMILLQAVCNEDNRHMISSRGFVKQFPIEERIHPILEGKIAPECWEVFMGIAKRCLKFEPDERPTIGEVEVLLEHALSLQEEADIRKTDGDYTLLSTTIIDLKWISKGDQEANSDYATPSLSSDDHELGYDLDR